MPNDIICSPLSYTLSKTSHYTTVTMSNRNLSHSDALRISLITTLDIRVVSFKLSNYSLIRRGVRVNYFLHIFITHQASYTIYIDGHASFSHYTDKCIQHMAPLHSPQQRLALQARTAQCNAPSSHSNSQLMQKPNNSPSMRSISCLVTLSLTKQFSDESTNEWSPSYGIT